MLESVTIGSRFGKLSVIGRSGNDIRKNRVWLCQCDCGNTIKVRTAELRNGRQKSCGCLHQETRKGRRRVCSHTKALDRFLYPQRRRNLKKLTDVSGTTYKDISSKELGGSNKMKSTPPT